MTPVRLLFLDDQVPASPAASPIRRSIVEDCRLFEVTLDQAGRRGVPAGADVVAAFHTGENDEGEHTYDAMRQAIVAGPGAQGWGLVLLDVAFGDKKHLGEEVRRQLLNELGDLPIVLLTASGEVDLKTDNAPYLSKAGLNRQELTRVLLQHGRLSLAQRRALLELQDHEVAVTPIMLGVFEKAFLFAKSPAPILLLGETGTGKEVLARYIHRVSGRPSQAFAAENMARVGATDPALLSILLFGRRRGAPNPTDPEEPGLFGLAEGGTLFLDEIAELPPTTQTSLLRVLEDGTYRRYGETRERKADVRILSATSRNLDERIRKGEFRDDLLPRVGRVPLEIPPLRERREEIPALSERFLQEAMVTLGKKGIVVHDQAQAALNALPYPDNVRGLWNVINMLVQSKGNHALIREADVELAAVTRSGSKQTRLAPTSIRVASPAEPISLSNFPEHLDAIPITLHDPLLIGILPKLDEAFTQLMRRVAGAALEGSKKYGSDKFNVSEAARLLRDDETLTGKEPHYTFERLLNIPRLTGKLDPEDAEALMATWRSGPGGSPSSETPSPPEDSP